MRDEKANGMLFHPSSLVPHPCLGGLPMTLIGLDLNATRVRAVQGPPQNVPMILPLNGNHDELPVAISLEERTLAVGAAGNVLRRQKSYLACLDFLGHLGTRKEWR